MGASPAPSHLGPPSKCTPLRAARARLPGFTPVLSTLHTADSLGPLQKGLEPSYLSETALIPLYSRDRGGEAKGSRTGPGLGVDEQAEGLSGMRAWNCTHGLLHNLQGPGQKENAEPLV